MTMFRFVARDSGGAESTGERDAADRYALSRVLRGEGLTVLSVEEVGDKKKKSLGNYLPDFLNPIKLEDKINITRNLRIRISAMY